MAIQYAHSTFKNFIRPSNQDSSIINSIYNELNHTAEIYTVIVPTIHNILSLSLSSTTNDPCSIAKMYQWSGTHTAYGWSLYSTWLLVIIISILLWTEQLSKTFKGKRMKADKLTKRIWLGDRDEGKWWLLMLSIWSAHSIKIISCQSISIKNS